MIPTTLQARWLANLLPEQRSGTASQILKEYLDGANIRDIAAEMRLSHSSLYSLLLKECEDQWKDAQVARALAALEDAETSLKNAKMAPA